MARTKKKRNRKKLPGRRIQSISKQIALQKLHQAVDDELYEHEPYNDSEMEEQDREMEEENEY